MSILDLLFGQQQQPQGGMVQDILSQRFQPTQQDIGNSDLQALVGKVPTPYDAMQQRLTAGNLGETGQGLQLQNQMTEFQMPFIKQSMSQLYGGNDMNPPVGFPGQSDARQPNPSVGFSPPSQPKDPRIARAEIAAMTGNKVLAETLMQDYNADPNVIQRKKTAEATGTDIAQAQKGVVGIDSRLQNAIDILNEQIELAPKTYSGQVGALQEGTERNMANYGFKSKGPSYQTQFEQNNANLFTQELPAIMQGMPGSRMDIPLINAIKNASQVNQYGTPDEKITASQNLKKLLMKYQKNTHNYATQMGAPNTPIQPMSDENPPQDQGGMGGDMMSNQSGRLKVIIPDGQGGFQTGTIDAAHKDTLPEGAQIVP